MEEYAPFALLYSALMCYNEKNMKERRHKMKDKVSSEKRLWAVESPIWQRVLRVFTLGVLFVAAYSLVQSVVFFISATKAENISMLVVAIYLLITPFCFLAALFWAYSVHGMLIGKNGDFSLVLGFAMLVLAAVDNTVYVSIHHEGDSLTFYVMGGLQIVCSVIGFLYYQELGNKRLTVLAMVLLWGCSLLDLIEAVRYYASIDTFGLFSYYMAQTVLSFLLTALGVAITIFADRETIYQK